MMRKRKGARAKRKYTYLAEVNVVVVPQVEVRATSIEAARGQALKMAESIFPEGLEFKIGYIGRK
jgi:hypothetical protein